MVKKLWSAASHNFIKVLLTPQLTKMGIFLKESRETFSQASKRLPIFVIVYCICKKCDMLTINEMSSFHNLCVNDDIS